MLQYLSINNYALIDTIEIDFCKGFSVITGETGSGKSILLGALQLILGEPILGWDEVGNISQAIGKLGQNTFIGVAALLFFYTMVVKDKKL